MVLENVFLLTLFILSCAVVYLWGGYGSLSVYTCHRLSFESRSTPAIGNKCERNDLHGETGEKDRDTP